MCVNTHLLVVEDALLTTQPLQSLLILGRYMRALTSSILLLQITKLLANLLDTARDLGVL